MDDPRKPPPAPSPPAVVRPEEVSAGAESVISEHVAKMLHAPPSRRWFWINLVLLLVLSAAGTWWFTQHLEPFFTEIVLVGGSLTLWAFLRLLWDVIEKATGAHPVEHSRPWLASPALTRLLVVAAIVLAVLWPSTTSMYFEYGGSGAGESDYDVEVTRTADKTRFMPPLKISSTSKVEGRPFFWQHALLPLQCRIVKPAGFDPVDCSLRGARSVRLKVPGSFAAQELHLLRLVPAGRTFIELPLPSDSSATRYQMTIDVDGQQLVLDDLRKQTVYVGGAGERMASVLELESAAEYGAFLARSLRAAKLDEDSAAQAASLLSTHTRAWDALQLKAGQTLGIAVRWSRNEGGTPQGGVMPGFPIHYTVTSDKVQTVWLPSL
jgi:hypothetical protein